MDILPDAEKYLFRIRDLLEQMRSAGLLVYTGPGGRALIPGRYYSITELTILQTLGLFRFTPVLGADFLFHLAQPCIVQITGKNEEGDCRAGTGVVFHRNYVLTCRHVLTDMVVDSHQVFQGLECAICDCFKHDKVDVGVIRVNRRLQTVSGLAFLEPAIAQSVFLLGYPTIPYTIALALTMQPGAVTSESVTTLDGDNVFLYSAISRPGNSGGPVFSSKGYIVGISMGDPSDSTSSENLSRKNKKDDFSPHYAGIPSHEIAKAIDGFGIVDDCGIGVSIPFERWL